MTRPISLLLTLLIVTFAGTSTTTIDLVWRRQSSFGIYKSAQISATSKKVFAGTTDVYDASHPDESELLNFSSSIPEWISTGPNQQVVASRKSNKVASVLHIYDQQSQNITVRVWSIDKQNKKEGKEPKPEIEVTFKDAAPAETCLKLSRDGKRLGILYNKPDNTTHLVIYDTERDQEITSYTGKGWGRHLTMSSDEDERYFAFHVAGAITVYDSKQKQVRWTGIVQFSDYALDITADAHTLIYGFEILTIAQWNGKEYVPVHTTTLKGYYVSNLIAQLDKLVIGWAAFDNLQTIIQVYHLGTDGSIKIISTFEYGRSQALQDIPADLSITDDAKFFVVGSWGNQTLTNPQVRLFSTGQANPIATFNTPGSVFSVDVVTDITDPTLLHIVAGCKSIHANISGRGGSLYLLNYSTKKF
jgi:hypothetical protein